MEELIIEPGRADQHYWRDLWKFRELFYFLAWRDILVRYKQTVVGVSWSILRPLLTMIILNVIFGKVGKFPSDGVPYPVLIYVAMLPWQLFTNSFSESGNSLVANSGLISKIYFPRLIVPAGSVVVGFIDFLISSLILVGLMVWYDYFPDWRIITLPFFLLLALAASLGAGFLVSALTVKYRDFRFIVPFVIQFGMYLCPVAYSSSVIYTRYPQWSLVYSMNPMVGIIDGFRWALLRGQAPLHLEGIILSVFLVIGLLFLGIWYFRKTERTFADVI